MEQQNRIAKGTRGFFSNARNYSDNTPALVGKKNNIPIERKPETWLERIRSEAAKWLAERFKWSRVITWSIILFILIIAVAPPIRARIFSILNLGDGAKTGVEEEVLEKRTRYSKVFRNESGTFTSLIFAAPIHYLDEDGKWQDLEGQIVDDNGAGAGFLVKFGKVPGIEFMSSKTQLKLEAENAKAVNGITDGNKITYFDVYDATDIRYAVGATQLEQKIILKNKAAPSSFSIKITSNTEIPPLENDELRFPDCNTVRPFARDASGRSYPVPVELARLKDGSYLIINADNSWLAEAKYPVIINANIAHQSDSDLGQDAYIDQNNDNGNFGEQVDLGVYDNVATKTRGYFQFDLSSIPDGSIISSASIQLYAQDALGGAIHLRKVTSPWDEKRINWNNQPLFEEVVDSKLVDTKSTWFAWNISQLAKDWCGGKIPNYGVALMTGETGMNSGALFCSSDYSDDIALRPKLVVDYVTDNEPPGSVIKEPQDGLYLKGTSYVISGSANDDPEGSGLDKVQISLDGGNNWQNASGIDSWTYKWDIPPDGTYNIRSRAIDLAGNIETPSPGITVTIDNTSPNALIASPKGGPIKGILRITGAASDENFKSYKLEYGTGASPNEWTQFGALRLEPVLKGNLGDGFTYGMNNGMYTIRLIVEDKAGNISTDSITVLVAN